MEGRVPLTCAEVRLMPFLAGFSSLVFLFV